MYVEGENPNELVAGHPSAAKISGGMRVITRSDKQNRSHLTIYKPVHKMDEKPTYKKEYTFGWDFFKMEALQKGYFSNQAYYRLNCVDSQGIDNADQRLTQDIERMCNQLATTVLPACLIGPFVVAYYTVKTWKTAGPFGVGAIYLYFIIGTIMNKFLISPLSKWSARVELNEGNFRYKQVTIRDNSEAIAFYRAEEFEDTMSKKTLYQLLNCQLRLMFWRFPSAFWKQFYDYYGGLLSYAIQYIPIFLMHSYDDSKDLVTIISNNAFVYIYLVNSFTRMTDVASTAGEMSGILQRVADFARCIENIQKSKEYENSAFSARNSLETRVEPFEDEAVYEIENVTYTLPTDFNYILLEGLNLRVVKGKNLFITGPSGAGKSSLLRILAGLWDLKHGNCF
uniref:ABC transmembrane type-1 domain-containing protein n=1 Tax=Acrobeloides nanus TaxID=290746 RepID=A0A914CIK1_9BILA